MCLNLHRLLHAASCSILPSVSVSSREAGPWEVVGVGCLLERVSRAVVICVPEWMECWRALLDSNIGPSATGTLQLLVASVGLLLGSGSNQGPGASPSLFQHLSRAAQHC